MRSTLNPDDPKDSAAHYNSRIKGHLPLLCILFLALILRTYRLGHQSVDLDEANGMMALNGPGFLNSIRLALAVNDLSMPLYYIVQYLASCFIGTSVVAVRLLSISFSLTTIPILYLLGRDIFGRRAGLIAALLFALSPVHIFNGQMTRHYALLTLMAAISLYLFYRYTQSGDRRWFYTSALANVLLGLTHFFGALLIFCEMGYLILMVRRPYRRTAVWILIHMIVLLLPWTLWLKANMSAPEWAFPEYKPPAVTQIVFDMVGDDVVGRGGDGPSCTSKLWPFVPERWKPQFFAKRFIADWALVFLFLTSLGWLTWGVGRSSLKIPLSEWNGAKAGPMLLLLMVVVLPVLALAIASYALRPCIMPRYTIYCSLALYVIAGGAISSIHQHVLRGAALGVLVLLYGVQLFMMLPGPTRTDWMGVAAHIRSQQTPDDLILVSGGGANTQNTHVFHRNIPRVEIPIAPVFTLQAICDKTVCHLERPAKSGSSRKARVWCIFNRYFGEPFRNLDECLKARGLNVEVYDYPGGEGLVLYRIEAGPDFLSLAHASRLLIDADIDYEKLLSDWGVNYDNPEKKDAAVSVLRRLFETHPPVPNAYPFGLFCILLADEGAFGLALDVAKGSLARGADESEVYGIEAYLLFGCGDLEGARAAAEKAIMISAESMGARWTLLCLRMMSEPFAQVSPLLDSFAFFMYKPLFEAMFLRKDLAQARHEVHRLFAADQDVPQGIMLQLGLHDWLTPCGTPS